MSFRLLIPGIIIVTSLIFAVLFFGELNSEYGLEGLQQWADIHIRGAGIWGVALFVAFGAVFTGIGLSRQAYAFVAGYLFGVSAGTSIALSAEMIGVLLGFYYARLLARDLVTERYSDRVRGVNDFLRDHPFSMTLAVRLFPVGHNLVVNLLAGVSQVRVLPFLAASIVGHLPQTLAFAMVGGGVAKNDFLHGALAVVLFVISMLLGVYLHHKYRRGRVFINAAEDADDSLSLSLDGIKNPQDK